MATRHIILLSFILINLVNTTTANRTLRKLNSKINLIKTTFQKEVDELKYTVLDLSTELDLERYRTDQLEKQLNETLNGGLGVGEGESKGPSNNAAIEKLQKKIENQEKLLKQNVQKLENEKVKRLSLEATLQSMKDKCDLLDNQATLIKSQQSMIEEMKEHLTNLAKTTSDLEENFTTEKLKETNQIRSSMGLFTRSIKLAFKTEKALLRNATRSLRSDEMVGKMIKDELEAVKGDTNNALERIKTNMTNMQINIDEVSDLVRSTGKTLETLDTTFTDNLQNLNSTIALLETKVENSREGIEEVSECCSQRPKTVGTTRRPEQTTPRSLVPVTLESGGPYIIPLYEEELAKAIKIGSRVVRGRDWGWGSQDGTPPGPGTVISWYGAGRSSKQVMVQWDRGTKANYRVGAYNKYDLYLLANQSESDRDSTETDIQPIFGPALEDAIKIGSRVVRGKDWSWGSQDGNPPTPGTVTGWYGGKKSTQQVMVRWDSGQHMNYRVGAHGKYDLYLLKDQSSPSGV